MVPRVVAFTLLLSIVVFAANGRAEEEWAWHTANPAFRVEGAMTGGGVSLLRTTSDPTNQVGG